MKLDIVTADRIGITQEILTVFSANQWNIRVMEVMPNHIYVHLQEDVTSRMPIEQELLAIDGVEYIQKIEQLPSEQKARHLDALLSNIPDPIIDIDGNGHILVANKAAKEVVNLAGTAMIGKGITEFVDVPLQELIAQEEHTKELVFAGQPFFADVTPVSDKANSNGAVILLRSLNKVGRQITIASQGQGGTANEIIGQSPQIQKVLQECQRFSNLDLPILIAGETGTGKELLARAVHFKSRRSEQPLLAINCAALPEHLLESELFGYAPGAFSGAQRSGKPGLFELADGGTIFLDEVAEMSPYLQAKLLRFLQDFSFRRVGGTKEITVDIRIISASHRNLLDLVETKQFREDLFYRLNVLNMHVPPLRERKSDIPQLVAHFCQRAAAQLDINTPHIAEADMRLLQQRVWPGNIRQLQNEIFRAVALAENGCIDTAIFTKDIDIDETVAESLDWKSAQAEFEKQLLTQLLPLYPTTRKLAERLKVSHNKIAMKLREHGIG